MKILVTGSCGYKGAVLVPKLLTAGHRVVGFDTQWFGRNLPEHERLSVIKGDIRDDGLAPLLQHVDAIIHLAGIANDPCGELDAKLTWEVNVFATMRLAEAAARAGVKQFIFASSASVYGIQDNRPVTEDSPMAPVSDYNRTKMVAERVLMSYAGLMDIKIVRPATICGVSPRMRLDVVVNMLTAQALESGVITAHCGKHGAALMRPHCHIEDVTALFVWLLTQEMDDLNRDLTAPAHCCIFNAGFDNMSVGDTAQLIRERVPADLSVSQVADKRSYCVDSSRLLGAGFRPKRGVADAIADIAEAWKAGRIRREPRSMNLAWMRSQGLVAE